MKADISTRSGLGKYKARYVRPTALGLICDEAIAVTKCIVLKCLFVLFLCSQLSAFGPPEYSILTSGPRNKVSV